MAADAEKARELFESYFSGELDFSPGSLEALDGEVAAVDYAMPGGASEENVELCVRLWGAYVGEVFRRNLGGEWRRHVDPWGEAIALKGPGMTVFPHDKVRKRFANGEEDSLVSYYQVMAVMWSGPRESGDR